MNQIHNEEIKKILNNTQIRQYNIATKQILNSVLYIVTYVIKHMKINCRQHSFVEMVRKKWTDASTFEEEEFKNIFQQSVSMEKWKQDMEQI